MVEKLLSPHLEKKFLIKQVHQWMEDLRPGRYLTFGGRYLTFGGKNQNSAALRFCIWPFYTFLCDISTIQ